MALRDAAAIGIGSTAFGAADGLCMQCEGFVGPESVCREAGGLLKACSGGAGKGDTTTLSMGGGEAALS